LARLRDTLIEEQQRMARVLTRIEKVLGDVDGPEVTRTDKKSLPRRSSPLDKSTAVTGVTADLREENGNLSAVRVAKLYGTTLSQLAAWLGRTKQAVSKTPDAESLQESLGYFERIARMRLLLKSDAEFRKWLRKPHPEVDANNPLDLIAKHQWQAVADFVDDILSGTPG
jgi:Protein of unknown function (DUF2384)